MSRKKTNSIKISVIIPVYNAGAFLDECLSSVSRQTLQEIEVICINDGSTDNSKEILERFAKEDKRFIILEQEHSNAGVARN
ncbi:MAG: glycosyltransferase, partial [Erysipelotrichaceae bacterium]|nr:glycosyltransferase [Erysipelotrichaceae bacterium]